METQVLTIDGVHGLDDAIRRGADVLRRGGLVAFPTETVYGLGARADDASAMRRLREVKDRSSGKAFTVHIGSPDDAARYVAELRGVGARIMRKGWPGPLTLIFGIDDPSGAPIAAGLDDEALSSLYHESTIGLRCPEDGIARGLLCAVDAPVVAASANLAGEPPPVMAQCVQADLGGRIDLLIDAGRTRYTKPSTIVRIEGCGYNIVRQGVLDAGIIERLSMLRILMVCTGNTCRSPMAVGLAQNMLAQRIGCRASELPARGIVVTSAGTSGGGGGASPSAVSVMARRGVDLSGHVSSALTPELVRDADHVYTMTTFHRDAVLQMDPSASARVALVAGDRDVADPLGGGESDYERCAKMLEEGLLARLQEVVL